MGAIWIHLVQSTLFGALVVAVYLCLSRRAGAIRYALLLAAVIKFAIPVAVLVDAGTRIGNFASLRASMPARLSVFPSDFYSALTASPGLPQATTHSSVCRCFSVRFGSSEQWACCCCGRFAYVDTLLRLKTIRQTNKPPFKKYYVDCRSANQ